jgi:thioredoxin 1
MEKAKISFQELIQGDVPVLVDFSAEWCGPCKMMAPILKETSGKFGDTVRIIKIDVDKNPGPSAAYSITGVPTLILFKGGKILWRKSGVVSASDLAQTLRQFLP